MYLWKFEFVYLQQNIKVWLFYITATNIDQQYLEVYSRVINWHMGYSMEGGMKYGEKDFNLIKLLKNQPYLIIKSQLKGVVTVKQNI